MARARIGTARKVVLPEALMDDLTLIAALRGVARAVVIREALTAYARRALSGRGKAA